VLTWAVADYPPSGIAAAHAAYEGAAVQIQTLGWQVAFTQAPQSQSRSVLHARTTQPRPGRDGSHVSFTPHGGPAEHGIAVHPCASLVVPGAHCHPVGHA
jgi:hypothetical protein